MKSNGKTETKGYKKRKEVASFELRLVTMAMAGHGNESKFETCLLTKRKENIKTWFCQSQDGMFGPGVYVTHSLDKASRYPLDLDNRQKVVLKLLVNAAKVKKIDYHGYDTAWCPPSCGKVKSGLEEDCVWDPRRIKVIDLVSPMPCTILTLHPRSPVEGKIYVMYHGTTAASAQSISQNGFRQSKGGMLGPGVYVSRDLQKASRYPLDIDPSQKIVLKLLVNVGKVKMIDYQGHPLQKTWHYHGYNTAWCPPNCGMVPSGLEEDCVWDPKRIKVIDAFRPKSNQYNQWCFTEKLKLKPKKFKIKDRCCPSRRQRYFLDHGKFEIRLVIMASYMENIWAEEDGPGFNPPCLESFVSPVEGKIYVMYHGTSAASAQAICKSGFRQSKGGMLGPGVYVSRDVQKASRYPLDIDPSQKIVLKLRVNVGKVKMIDNQGHPLRMTWHDHGYDTAWCPPNCGMVPSGLEEDCVWDPKRIKVIDAFRPKINQNNQWCFTEYP
ncbi:uncharacterized protein LOC116991159 [Amblyraja radiata]|uniref:uncharacterized protein LOC116991159 n=1 Tax=Amblyraja radiata TaxID=386614 RepID=UPI001403FAE8|nr:uncharacterized protein LOC116991159 [Amblyraja radiata]